MLQALGHKERVWRRRSYLWLTTILLLIMVQHGLKSPPLRPLALLSMTLTLDQLTTICLERFLLGKLKKCCQQIKGSIPQVFNGSCYPIRRKFKFQTHRRKVVCNILVYKQYVCTVSAENLPKSKFQIQNKGQSCKKILLKTITKSCL